MRYVYKKDKIEPEPRPLLAKLALGGVLAAFLAIILELILGTAINGVFYILPYNDFTDILYLAVSNFIGVAFVEEASKFLFGYLFSWKDRAFNYRFDGVIYMCFVSLGFAAFENVIYLFRYGNSVLLVRALISIPGHFAFAVIMGSFYGLAKYYSNYGDRQRSDMMITFGLILSILAHGFFDFCLSIESTIMTFIFLGFIIVLDIIIFSTVRRVASNDHPIEKPHMTQNNYQTNYQDPYEYK